MFPNHSENHASVKFENNFIASYKQHMQRPEANKLLYKKLCIF
jgi:hypothetical protein